MRRSFWVWLHRWTGLAMAGFLIVVGLTGSLLAFYSELERLISPQLYVAPREDAVPLDAATLAQYAEALVPQGRVYEVAFPEPDQVLVTMEPRLESEGAIGVLDFNQLFLDAYTGKELGRRSWGDLSEGLINLMPFIYSLHFELALGTKGLWTLGIVALVWTLDCFVGLYLTLPVAIAGFWKRWKPAWLIKWKAGAFRLNFDLHQASGLWLWAMLLIFAWSSVYMNLYDTVYAWTTRALLVYKTADTELHLSEKAVEIPALSWHEAQKTGAKLMANEASAQGFRIDRLVSLAYDPMNGLYHYVVHSSRDVQDKRGKTEIYFDGITGTLSLVLLPSGQYGGNTVTSWLYALHEANVFGLPYRIFVCGLGLVIVMLSVTGVYIWWKKRQARNFSKTHRVATADSETVAAE